MPCAHRYAVYSMQCHPTSKQTQRSCAQTKRCNPTTSIATNIRLPPVGALPTATDVNSATGVNYRSSRRPLMESGSRLVHAGLDGPAVPETEGAFTDVGADVLLPSELVEIGGDLL